MSVSTINPPQPLSPRRGLLGACEGIRSPLAFRLPGESRGPLVRRTNCSSVNKALRLLDAPAPVDAWIPAFAGNGTSHLVPARHAPDFLTNSQESINQIGLVTIWSMA